MVMPYGIFMPGIGEAAVDFWNAPWFEMSLWWWSGLPFNIIDIALLVVWTGLCVIMFALVAPFTANLGEISFPLPLWGLYQLSVRAHWAQWLWRATAGLLYGFVESVWIFCVVSHHAWW